MGVSDDERWVLVVDLFERIGDEHEEPCVSDTDPDLSVGECVESSAGLPMASLGESGEEGAWGSEFKDESLGAVCIDDRGEHACFLVLGCVWVCRLTIADCCD